MEQQEKPNQQFPPQEQDKQPGPIWTPLIPATFDAEHVSTFGAKVPLKRAGQPSEVAPAFVYLACNDSSYITGQTIHPNGGEVING